MATCPPPRRRRTRLFATGALASLLTQVINALGQILLVPLFLLAWGSSRYGEWLAVSAVVAYASLLDGGVQTWVVNRLNALYAKNELVEYARTLHSALHWSLVVSVGALGVVIATVLLVPLDTVLGLASIDRWTTSLLLALLAIQIIVTLPAGLISGIYRTVGEFARGLMIANIQRASHFALTALALWLGAGLPVVAVVQLVPLAAGLAYAARDLRRRHPEIPLGIANRDFSLALGFLGPSLLFLLIQFAQVLGLQGGVLVVSALFGSTSVVVFVTSRTLANLVRQVSGSLGNALWPELTVLQAQDRLDTVREVHRLAVKVVLALTIAAAVLLHFVAEDLVRAWTRNRINYDAQLMDALLVLLVLQALWTVSSIVLMAWNRNKLVALCYVLSNGLGLMVGFLMAGSMGLAGLVYGLCIADACVNGVFIPWSTCRALRQDLGAFVREIVLKGAAASLIVWLAATWSSQAVQAFSLFPRIAIVGSLVAVVTIVATGALWLDSSERGRVRACLAQVPGWRGRGRQDG